MRSGRLRAALLAAGVGLCAASAAIADPAAGDEVAAAAAAGGHYHSIYRNLTKEYGRGGAGGAGSG